MKRSVSKKPKPNETEKDRNIPTPMGIQPISKPSKEKGIKQVWKTL